MKCALAGWVCLAIAFASGKVATAGEALADPTRPATASVAANTPAQPVGLRVQAVLTRQGSRIAIVNDRIVRAGDRIGAIWIEEVTADGVRYRQDGQTHFARVPGTSLSVRQTLVSKKDVP